MQTSFHTFNDYKSELIAKVILELSFDTILFNFSKSAFRMQEDSSIGSKIP